MNVTSLPVSTRYDLDEWEHVTCMKTVALRSQETVSGLKGYVAAGTCLMQGEEVTCRGRVSSSHLYHQNKCPSHYNPHDQNKAVLSYELRVGTLS